MSDRDPTGIDAKVLTISDGVIHGTREDKSGVALHECLTRHGFSVVAFGVSPAPESEPDVEYRWQAA